MDIGGSRVWCPVLRNLHVGKNEGPGAAAGRFEGTWRRLQPAAAQPRSHRDRARGCGVQGSCGGVEPETTRWTDTGRGCRPRGKSAHHANRFSVPIAHLQQNFFFSLQEKKFPTMTFLSRQKTKTMSSLVLPFQLPTWGPGTPERMGQPWATRRTCIKSHSSHRASLGWAEAS